MKLKIDRLINGISVAMGDSLCGLLMAYKEGRISKEAFRTAFDTSAQIKISMTLDAIDTWKDEPKSEDGGGVNGKSRSGK